MNAMSTDTLRSRLAYEPRELKFGTSGRRGPVANLTQLEIYINVTAELEYLQSLPSDAGGVNAGDVFYYACDLRPSSPSIAQAVERAIRDAGMTPVNLGCIPTPALTGYAIERGRGSIMVTGSHIPFERNGYKCNSAKGELLKSDEDPISDRVEQVRQRIYHHPFASSPFNEQGQFKTGLQELAPHTHTARNAYIERYRSFFADRSLNGKRLLVYQHSAVGRDILVEILQKLGADVVAAGRSDTFVPIDTENIDDAQLATVQSLVDQAGKVDAVVSTDGDSDRPLLLGVERGKVKFFGGDLLGMIVAEFLGADAVVVPISCNDGIDRGKLKSLVEPKTKIGSPYVITGMEQARAKGRKLVCGWEANGGFLLGSDIVRGERTLRALPTRDAVLPILCVLFAAGEKRSTVADLFARLPKRYSKAALLRNVPRAVSRKIAEQFADPQRLAPFFAGFAAITKLDLTDGVRIYFANGDVAHIRPSGNADEIRIYAVADKQARADEIARLGVAEPEGILRRLVEAAQSGG
ncbi:MAG: phosphomannomutase [Verrucomicrobia bacterium]|nr:phosphomannomutase [Verrucomicrobiota bacterium]